MIFCQNLTEFYQISLKNLAYLTDYGIYETTSSERTLFLQKCRSALVSYPTSRNRLCLYYGLCFDPGFFFHATQSNAISPLMALNKWKEDLRQQTASLGRGIDSKFQNTNKVDRQRSSIITRVRPRTVCEDFVL